MAILRLCLERPFSLFSAVTVRTSLGRLLGVQGLLTAQVFLKWRMLGSGAV